MWRFGSCIAASSLIWYFSVISFYPNIAIVTLLYLFSGGWKWLLLLSKVLKRDLLLLRGGALVAIKTKRIINNKILLSDKLFENTRKYPDKLAYISADTGKCWTFLETEEFVVKVANLFYASGYKKGDVVALVMENRIEYTPLWLGLSMIGVVTSLVNYNLRHDSLKHCIAISNCKAVIFSEDLSNSVEEIKNDLTQEMYCLDTYSGNMSDVKCISKLLETIPALKPPRPSGLNVTDPLLYMYTSGTTGLPKAVIVRAQKMMSVLLMANAMLGVGPKDVFYDSLPLYHANGGATSCHSIFNACTVVIKKKFSASRFMEECCKYKVTSINYIGEICRYLLAQPPRKFDQENQIKLASGNGLKASIWKEFQERFGIEKIVEVYGSTEGNVALINLTGHLGAVGFSFVAFPFLNKNKIIKVDRDTGEIIRGRDGLAMLAKPGEPGQIVGLIEPKGLVKYDGYLDKTATNKKIASDILTKGDKVFLSGDILVMDELGYFYFQDRTGDTFRWRGENVSTNEVEGIISRSVNLTDVTVYGVEIPGEEGRAGMACFNDPERKINVGDLQLALQRDLPKYAHPIFLRMSSSMDLTGTFKFQKNKLRDESFDLEMYPNDDFYYYNIKERSYAKLTEEIRQEILNRSVRF